MIDPVSINAYFLVPDRVQLLDLTGPAHLFYEAIEYGAPHGITYVSMEQKSSLQSADGLHFSGLMHFEELQLRKGDVLFLPGIDPSLLLDYQFRIRHQRFFNWLDKQYGLGVKICSVCTGAYLCAFSGLLSGRMCTTHWKYFDDFKQRFPDALLQADRLIVKDGLLYSSAGVSAGIDLALFILEELYGPVFVAKIAKEVVIYMRRSEQDPQLSVFLQYRNHIESRIHQIQDVLAQRLEQRSTIEELAESVHMSPRNLTRLFKKTTGVTIGQYHTLLRRERAQHILSNGGNLSEAAHACGLKSAKQLRFILDDSSLSKLS